MIKPAIKLLRLKHVNNYMGIYFPHQPYNIIHLIGRNYRVKHIHLLPAVTAHSLHAGDSVLADPDICLHHLVGLLRRNLQSHPVIPVVDMNWKRIEYAAFIHPNNKPNMQ